MVKLPGMTVGKSHLQLNAPPKTTLKLWYPRFLSLRGGSLGLSSWSLIFSRAVVLFSMITS